MPTDPERPNVYALQSKRTESNLRVRRGSMPAEERIAELETEVDKLVQLVLQQEQKLEELDDRQWRLVRLIGKRLGITGRKKNQ